MVIYADVLFAVNLLADYALLLGVRRFLHLHGPPLRLLCGAAVGALFAVGSVCLPLPSWVGSLLTVPTAFLVSAAAFSPLGRRGLLRAAAGFYVAGFLLAGMLLLVWQAFRPPGLYIKNNVVYYPVSLPVFFVLLCLLYGLSALLSRLVGETPPDRLFCRLRVCACGETVTLPAKLDTGCALREPFSGRPVVLASAGALGNALPPAVRTYLSSGEARPGLRLVPYDTVEGHGLLPAFFPDTVTDEAGHRLCCCIAVSRGPIGGSGFAAIVNPAALGNVPGRL